MLRLRDCDRAQIERRLAGPGLPLGVGPYVLRLRGRDADWIGHLRQLYADFPVLDEPAVAHYHIAVVREGVGRWGKSDGINVIVDGFSPFLPGEIRHAMTMFESLLNYIIAATGQQHLVFHAAVVERGGHAVLLAAPSGSGKSTLCAALVGSGWRLLSDEFAIIRFEDGLMLPCPRPISLKNDSIPRIRALMPAAEFSPPFEGTVKGTIAYVKPPADATARMAEQARPVAVLFPQFRTGAPLTVEPMEKARGMANLITSGLNYRSLGLDGFHAAAALVDRCRFHSLEYGDTQAAVDAVERLHGEAA